MASSLEAIDLDGLMDVSISRINQLGERLRKAEVPSEEDLRVLNDYRLSFDSAYQAVADRIRGLELQVTGRPAKTTYSIVQKLQRERTRLSRMQDIAGCRIVVADVIAQESAILLLQKEFPEAKLSDRRLNPSHGYRAVHLIVEVLGKSVEIQVRTRLQHLWAEYSEKCADVIDAGLKYGAGNAHVLTVLAGSSRAVKKLEDVEYLVETQSIEAIEKLTALQRQISEINEDSESSEALKAEKLLDLRNKTEGLRSLYDEHIKESREETLAIKNELTSAFLEFTDRIQNSKPKGSS